MDTIKETPLFDTDDLYGVIEMFLEWRDVHGSTEEQAKYQAVGEFVDGWNATLELFQDGELDYPPTGHELRAQLAQAQAERDALKAVIENVAVGLETLVPDGDTNAGFARTLQAALDALTHE